jgi:hypothetical protein
MKKITWMITALSCMMISMANASIYPDTELVFGNYSNSATIDSYGMHLSANYATSNFNAGFNLGGIQIHNNIGGTTTTQDLKVSTEEITLKNSWNHNVFQAKDNSLTLPIKDCAYIQTDKDGIATCQIAPELPDLSIYLTKSDADNRYLQKTTGYTGTCPASYKLVIKNGLVVDCKRP